ncbi:phage tail protein [Serratia fonticola]|uniref:phage tail protein n=1 Tax=Serratia fonticola TaxID=47917 RepID=UPI00217796FF|nr:phage tail protein [Serratia fonticola]CAI2005814.1 Phage tail protein [Serratia fonticola]
MGFALPNGATVFVGSKMVAALPATAVSNAKGAVFTVTGGTLAANDIVLIKSGWGLIDNLVAKVTTATATAVTIGSLDTSDTNFFPPGAGVGSLMKITDWTQIPRITEVGASGGDQQYVQVQFLEDDRQRNLATFRAAKTQTFTFAHDSSLAVYNVLLAGDRSGDTLPFYMYVPKAKETRYWSGIASFDPQPTTAVNQVETVQVSIAVQSRTMTFYKDK